MLLDRKVKKVITHRIACGRPGMYPMNNGRRAGKRGPPKALDHLEITTAEEQPDGSFPIDTEAMARLPGIDARYSAERPKRIPIRVASDNIDDFLTQQYEARASLTVLDRSTGEPMLDDEGQPLRRQRVWCQGNGQMAKRLVGKKQVETVIPCNASPFAFKARPENELVEIVRNVKGYDPNDGMRCPYAQNSDASRGVACKPSTVLLCRCDAVSNIGAWCRVVSHGHATADRIRSTLDTIQDMIPGRILTNVPLDLVLTMRPSTHPSARGRLQPALHIELRLPVEETVRLLDAHLQANMRLVGAAREHRLLLEAAKREADEDDEAEFGATTVIVEGQEGGGRL